MLIMKLGWADYKIKDTYDNATIRSQVRINWWKKIIQDKT